MIQFAFSSLAFFEWEKLQYPEIEDSEIVLEHGIAYLKKIFNNVLYQEVFIIFI